MMFCALILMMIGNPNEVDQRKILRSVSALAASSEFEAARNLEDFKSGHWRNYCWSFWTGWLTRNAFLFHYSELCVSRHSSSIKVLREALLRESFLGNNYRLFREYSDIFAFMGYVSQPCVCALTNPLN